MMSGGFGSDEAGIYGRDPGRGLPTPIFERLAFARHELLPFHASAELHPGPGGHADRRHPEPQRSPPQRSYENMRIIPADFAASMISAGFGKIYGAGEVW